MGLSDEWEGAFLALSPGPLRLGTLPPTRPEGADAAGIPALGTTTPVLVLRPVKNATIASAKSNPPTTTAKRARFSTRLPYFK